MEKMFRTRTQAEEKEDRQVLDFVKGQLNDVRSSMKVQFWNAGKENPVEEGVIYLSIKRIDAVVAALSSYLSDGEIAKRALERNAL